MAAIAEAQRIDAARERPLAAWRQMAQKEDQVESWYRMSALVRVELRSTLERDQMAETAAAAQRHQSFRIPEAKRAALAAASGCRAYQQNPQRAAEYAQERRVPDRVQDRVVRDSAGLDIRF